MFDRFPARKSQGAQASNNIVGRSSVRVDFPLIILHLISFGLRFAPFHNTFYECSRKKTGCSDQGLHQRIEIRTTVGFRSKFGVSFPSNFFSKTE